MNFKCIAAGLLAVLALSCEEVVKFSGVQTDPDPVIYSFATAGEPLTVDISSSVFFLDDIYNWKTGYSGGFYEPLKDKIRSVEAYVNGCKSPVAFSLVRKPDGNPDLDASCVLYRYESAYKPAPGDKIEYRVSIDGYDGIHSTASIPCDPVCSIEKIDTTENILKVKFVIDDNPDETNYYAFESSALVMYDNYDWLADTLIGVDTLQSRFAVSIVNDASDATSEIIGALDEDSIFLPDELFNGRQHTVNLELYVYNWDIVSLDIVVKCLSPSLYYYWSTREKLEGISSFIGEGVHVYSNVDGGIGCCAGQVVKRIKCI